MSKDLPPTYLPEPPRQLMIPTRPVVVEMLTPTPPRRTCPEICGLWRIFAIFLTAVTTVNSIFAFLALLETMGEEEKRVLYTMWLCFAPTTIACWIASCIVHKCKRMANHNNDDLV